MNVGSGNVGGLGAEMHLLSVWFECECRWGDGSVL